MMERKKRKKKKTNPNLGAMIKEICFLFFIPAVSRETFPCVALLRTSTAPELSPPFTFPPPNSWHSAPEAAAGEASSLLAQALPSQNPFLSPGLSLGLQRTLPKLPSPAGCWVDAASPGCPVAGGHLSKACFVSFSALPHWGLKGAQGLRTPCQQCEIHPGLELAFSDPVLCLPVPPLRPVKV